MRDIDHRITCFRAIKDHIGPRLPHGREIRGQADENFWFLDSAEVSATS